METPEQQTMPLSKKRFFELTALCFLAFSLSTNAADFGADRHIKRGVTCQTCHGPDMKDPKFPETSDCIKCHDKGGLISKTKALEPNPHDAPHNGDCVLCHVQHEAPENYCAQCHKFDYKVK